LSPEKKHLYHRKCNLKKLYGLTLEEYEELCQKQEGRCAICGGVMNPPCVDHNHKTGENRGLLCVRCNFVLGEVKENPKLLEAMIKYLTQPPLVLGKPDDAIPHTSPE
jgi:hypothetical protein